MRLDPPDGRLIAGRGIVVTGAASGIGRALAKSFAADRAVVVGVDRNAEGITALEAEGVIPLTGDVTEPTVLDEAAAIVARRAGHVDVLVNNAGFGLRRAIEDLTVGEFEGVYAVHVLASLYGIRSVVPHMRRQGSGRIVNVVSRAAEACQANNAAYASAKAALWAISRTAAAELGSSGILVNCLIPGMTNTGIWGRPRPELQDPGRVYPTALALATLPEGGPSGRVFWDLAEYPLFSRTVGTGCEVVR
jgi:NAD(P)-dependent dehydrogenase (short-subunit alcohol dehydrogenase family)